MIQGQGSCDLGPRDFLGSRDLHGSLDFGLEGHVIRCHVIQGHVVLGHRSRDLLGSRDFCPAVSSDDRLSAVTDPSGGGMLATV